MRKEILRNIIFTVSFLLLVAIIVAFCFFYAKCVFANIESWQNRGLFGDMFGAVNTFFSGCAFVGIIFAILLQHKELSLQRTELELTRDQLTKSAESQKEQANILSETAKLHALTSLTSYYLKLKEMTPGGGHKNQQYSNDAERYRKELEQCLLALKKYQQ